MMVLEVADEATPAPSPAYDRNGIVISNPSYIISAFPLSLHTVHRVTFHRPLPSGVSGGRRGRVIVRTLGGGSSTTP